MRDLVLFIASLAGATTLTALAILIRPESPFWKVLLWSGIAIFISCACIIIIDYVRPNASRVLLFGIGAGIALTVACSIALFQEESKATGQQLDIVISLSLDCRRETIPTASLPNKVLTILQITTALGEGMVTETTIPANRQKLRWPRDYLNAMAFRCELINYGEKTVFDVKLPLHLTVREAVREAKDPGRISEGVTKPSRDYIFEIARINSGPDQSIVFYIFNQSPNFALIIPNETATLQQLGAVVRKTVPVMYSKKPGDIMSFVPFPQMKQHGPSQ